MRKTVVLTSLALALSFAAPPCARAQRRAAQPGVRLVETGGGFHGPEVSARTGYLKGVGGIDAARVITVDGGFREEVTVELWAPPAGATLPAAAPTVDPSEVKIIKDPPRRRRGRAKG